MNNMTSDEVSEARNKLDHVLNELIDKNGEMSNDDKSLINTNIPLTPSKRVVLNRSIRKKKRKDYNTDDYASPWKQQSFVKKIFDREVDLSRFDESTSFYHMLREWMKNNPNTEDDDDNNTSTKIHLNNLIENPHEVTSLPYSKRSSDIPSYPKPISRPDKHAKIEDIIDTDYDITELLKDNMNHWKKVRNKWKEHSFKLQENNIECLQILRGMVNQQSI